MKLSTLHKPMDISEEVVKQAVNKKHEANSAARSAAIARKKNEGEWMHQAPLGYRLVRDSQGRSLLELDPTMARMVVRAQTLAEDGLPVRDIATRLNKAGFRSKRGCYLSPATVWRLLKRIQA